MKKENIEDAIFFVKLLLVFTGISLIREIVGVLK